MNLFYLIAFNVFEFIVFTIKQVKSLLFFFDFMLLSKI